MKLVSTKLITQIIFISGSLLHAQIDPAAMETFSKIIPKSKAAINQEIRLKWRRFAKI